jgi:putative ABC transport system substrate-binding protein
VTAFRQGLNEAGFIEGQNVAVEYRSAENDLDQLRALVNEFTRRPVSVIVGNVIAAGAAKAATTTVPIVFATGSDPVRDGLVDSLNQPGGNVTGVSFFGGVLGAKRLEMLRQLVPAAKIMAMLAVPNTPDTEADRKDVESAAQAVGQQLIVLDAASDRDIEPAFTRFVERGAGALITLGGAFMFSNRERIVALAALHRLPAIHTVREFVVAGGLMSYGASIIAAYRQVGIYAGRILKGEKPGDLPIMRSTKFEFVLNLKTANALGLAIPPTLLALADEVIE